MSYYKTFKLRNINFYYALRLCRLEECTLLYRSTYEREKNIFVPLLIFSFNCLLIHLFFERLLLFYAIRLYYLSSRFLTTFQDYTVRHVLIFFSTFFVHFRFLVSKFLMSKPPPYYIFYSIRLF